VPERAAPERAEPAKARPDEPLQTAVAAEPNAADAHPAPVQPAPVAVGDMARQTSDLARSVSSSLSGGAKIAASGARGPARDPAATRTAIKKNQTVDAKEVADTSESLGTAVAKVQPAMPTSTFSDRQQGSLTGHASAAVFETAKGGAQSAQPEAVATPHAAVQAAMNAADTLARSGGQSVNLKFQMGDTDLSVRVEVRNGEVHATFRTDSAALRSDLAREWQSVSAGSPSLQIAAPVITGSAAQDALAGGSGQNPRGGREPEAAPTFRAGAPDGASAPRGTDPVADRAAPAALPTSVHLLTFA
jgi:hypothetical protein